MTKKSYSNNHNVTFSGTDTLAFIILPNTAPIILGSITTFSYSSYRAKKPIQTLGAVTSRGTAKGSRIIAGTLVFTLISKHWVNDLLDQAPWLREACNGAIYSDELPLFDIMIISANEYGKYASMRILGVNLTDEAGVLSINDAYSENTFSFIAREISTFNNKEISKSDMTYSSNKLFKNFNISTFKDYSKQSPIKNNKIKLSKYKVEINNAIYNLSRDDFDILCNNLIRLGYTYDNISNTNVKITEDVFSIINRVYSGKEVDIDYFINNVLPEIETKHIETNNRYFASNREGIYAYSTLDLDSFTDIVDPGEEIIVFSDDINNDGDGMLYTDSGWIKTSDVGVVYPVGSVGSTNSPGITNMNVEVTVNGEKLEKGEKVIKFNGSYAEFFSKTSIIITIDNSSIMEFVSCISIPVNNSFVTDRNEFIVAKVHEVGIMYALKTVERHNKNKLSIIINSTDSDSFFTIDVEFNGGDS